MSNLKDIFSKWLNSSGGSQGPEAGLDESKTEIDSEGEFIMPDGTKIPKMPPSRPHWG